MTAFRLPGPVCRLLNTLQIDSGTLCRAASSPPGVLGLVPQFGMESLRRGVAVLPDTRPVATGPLQVAAGQITFDAEGNDVPQSPYYSRRVHWPGNTESGVTLGRGYDMGNRTEAEVQADMVAAGMSADKAKSFAKAAGKKGADAKKFVSDNRDSLGEISLDVQKRLFENIYPVYVTRAQANYDKWTASAIASGKVEWGDLHWAIRDILVDFVYQGFTKGPNPMIKGMRNDFDELITYLKENDTMRQYEAGRGRVKYLEASRSADTMSG